MFTCAFAGALVGCHSDSENSNLEAFSLTEIRASSSNVKAMTLNWTSASNKTGVTYTVCEKDSSKENNCDALSTTTDTLTATVVVDSLVSALSTDYFILASNGSSTVLSNEKTLTVDSITQMIGYFKASNTDSDDRFGYSLALSNDGSTLAVGAYYEDGSATSVITDGSETNDTGSTLNSGAVYLFSNSSGTWTKTAYVKASNAAVSNDFGRSVALNSDGSMLAVGAPYQNIGATSSGAVYLFSNSSSSWTQTAYLKASNIGTTDTFGYSVALSRDGSTLAVGAYQEDNAATGVITNGSESTDSGTATDSGAVYLFRNSSGSWAQTAYIKASNTSAQDYFGYSVALSSDGSTLAVGAYGQDGSATDSGAVYLFSTSPGSLAQTDYLKASNASAQDYFGYSIALSSDGSTLAVGAYGQDDSATDSGAVYLFSNSSSSWTQTDYLKATNIGAGDRFGYSLALSGDNNSLAVGAYLEDNSATGVITDGSETSNAGSATDSGAVYLFSNNSGSWTQTAYIKAPNTGADDYFGYSMALSSDGSSLAVGAYQEDNSATGVITDGSETNDVGSAPDSGAVYLY